SIGSARLHRRRSRYDGCGQSYAFTRELSFRRSSAGSEYLYSRSCFSRAGCNNRQPHSCIAKLANRSFVSAETRVALLESITESDRNDWIVLEPRVQDIVGPRAVVTFLLLAANVVMNLWSRCPILTYAIRARGPAKTQQGLRCALENCTDFEA